MVQARLGIDINANKAVAAVKQAEGDRDATRIRADGGGLAVGRGGAATGDAYRAQADVVGAERVALIKIFEEIHEGRVVITPQSAESVSAGGEDGSAALQGALISAFMANLLSGKSTLPSQPLRLLDRADYHSTLTSPSAPSKSSPVGPPVPGMPSDAPRAFRACPFPSGPQPFQHSRPPPLRA
ncbi:MAG: hypothetical protein KGI98_03240 [Euryarchaeota archaeon]|nr:hypothetical protein [Euryarchaeota archaeon]MDE1882168.1 hypothetical protein [Euryarchaeota archaeon]